VNKKKLFNDPVYGFISIPFDIVFDLIEHPYFQRLWRIKQLGLTHMVYPGAYHTRFHHALGTMYLMTQAIDVLRSKGHDISEEEAKGVTIAILLHDIGHGPFSHALESTIVKSIHHEELSILFMERLNKEFDGQLTTAISIFKNDYHKKFLHQLVSSQLDMDRLDYLRRDSFFTGVSEGVVGTGRIIKMLTVHNDQLVIEKKGIHSIEKFLIARTIMYWQVYLHKTVLAAEFLLVRILEKAKTLDSSTLFMTPALKGFIDNQYSLEDFKTNPELLDSFAELDDTDILSAIKVWSKHENASLAQLCQRLINRELFGVKIQNEAFSTEEIEAYKNNIDSSIPEEDHKFFLFSEQINNRMYNPNGTSINLIDKNGKIEDIVEASEQLNLSSIDQAIHKHFICFPKKRD
jgi:HD superfamily phosphohydrolase